MTAPVLIFPAGRVVRTPAQAEQHRQERISAHVARLTELMEANPRLLAMLDAEALRPQCREGQPS